jgi:hypothetical protein
VTPGRAELPADIARLLGRLRDGLAERGDLVGVYLYGSLATDDFSPGEIGDYWRRMARKRKCWLQDIWVDLGLTVLPRAEAVLTTGDLITKTEAIDRLARFGVPPALSDEIRRRRDGQLVTLSAAKKIRRAQLARRIVKRGAERLSRLEPTTPHPDR